MAIILYKPSRELVEMLLSYYESKGVNIKKFGQTNKIRDGIGHTFRYALLTFSIIMHKYPISLCSIIEGNKPGFTKHLDYILRRRLKIGWDRKGSDIILKMADDFKKWLSDIGGELKAEEENWHYTRIYLLDNEDESIIMNLNRIKPVYDARTTTIH